MSDDDLSELDKEFKLLTQSPGTIHAMKKLHEKIAEEHSRRAGIDSGNSMLHNMLHHNNDQSKPL